MNKRKWYNTDPNLLSKKQVAKELFVCENTINYWLKTGKIEGKKMGNTKKAVIKFDRTYIECFKRNYFGE